MDDGFKKSPWAPLKHSVGKAITDLKIGECKWPTYTHPHEDKIFCGAECSGTYCTEHKTIGTNFGWVRR